MWEKEEINDSSYSTEDTAQWLVKLKARIAGYGFVEDYVVREIFQNRSAKG